MNVEKYTEAVVKDLINLEESACGMPETIMLSKVRECFKKHIPVFVGDDISQKTDDCIYIVMARRWGDDEARSYICGWAWNTTEACQIADKEAEYRGGKYAGVVYRVCQGWDRRRDEVYRSKSRTMGGME